MPKQRTFRIREGEPLLDIASYGRGGPSETAGRLTPVQLEQIQRTVRRTPEVMVNCPSDAGSHGEGVATRQQRSQGRRQTY
jgi:hypothetical protein